MSEVAGLLVLSGNYELVDVVDTEEETKVVTGAVIQAAESNKLKELGWELVSPNVVVFRKNGFTPVAGDTEVRGLQSKPIIADEFEAAEPMPDEQW